jgi:hypothetical protein
MQRQFISTHLQPCVSKDIGCTAKVCKETLPKHLGECQFFLLRRVLAPLTQKIKDLEEKNRALECKVTQLQEGYNVMRQPLTILQYQQTNEEPYWIPGSGVWCRSPSPQHTITKITVNISTALESIVVQGVLSFYHHQGSGITLSARIGDRTSQILALPWSVDNSALTRVNFPAELRIAGPFAEGDLTIDIQVQNNSGDVGHAMGFNARGTADGFVHAWVFGEPNFIE